MARKAETAEVEITTSKSVELTELKDNMINLANDTIEKVKNKQINVGEGIPQIVAIYNAVK